MRMKKIVLLVCAMALGLVFSLSGHSSQAKPFDGLCKQSNGKSDIWPKGDDHFPWPWGSECVFPWSQIEGSYVVKSAVPSQYDGYYLVLEVLGQKDRNQNALVITQYDPWGRMYAVGKGVTLKNARLVEGVLNPGNKGSDYRVIIRSYPEVKTSRCSKNNQITAVTFCAPDQIKCMETSNYILEKLN